jgi:type IV fimbrial biogenesis protein FimT
VQGSLAQAGFTLAELLVTIAVGAVLLGIGVPSYTAFTKNANMVAAPNSFVFDLHFARDTAVTRNRRVAVCPSTSGAACNSADWATGWIVFVDTDNDGVLDAGEPIERVGERFNGVTVLPAVFANRVTYRPNGRVLEAVNGGGFLLCDDRGALHARGVLVELSGRPRVTKLGAMAPCPTT